MSTTVDGITRLDGFCSCGLEMKMSGTGYICTNCDVLQPQETDCGDPTCTSRRGEKCERTPGKRVATDRDYAYLKVWRQRILKIYPGQ